MHPPAPLNPLLYQDLVRRALLEDLGTAGDLTTDAVARTDARARGEVKARIAGRVAGLDAALSAFSQLDSAVAIEVVFPDGMDVEAGAVIAVVQGSAQSLLTGERTALNLLGRLSGIATATAEVVEAIRPYKARVACTRKTTPGLRALEKYAVRCGGGANHRFGLHDAVLIKDNHIVVAGSLKEAVKRVRLSVGHMVKIQVEVDTLEQLDEALSEGVDAVLLDNMDQETLRQAVVSVQGRALVEVSGGLTPQTARQAAAAGADLLSMGWLTHSAPALDVGLDLAPIREL